MASGKLLTQVVWGVGAEVCANPGEWPEQALLTLKSTLPGWQRNNWVSTYMCFTCVEVGGTHL